ncbi:hypothetical protein MesoLj131b_07980 [Mesorhizobium sp. 131-2-5]|uniref:hypothetical protein n=1 Tax=Mesorhizobium sp. 131-2-5 TaxID=2744519 RepID=UPI0019274748|nr:hypothetical protein [Mesorhizobium sp. 131-2-5]BCG98798.1 hypothetical protein MesoLj131b_07980 [Mesorhizobium sp. 131-2-5]
MSPEADYVCRVFVSKAEFADLLGRRIEAVDYPNFKASVVDRRLHDLYAEFWRLHLRYQWAGAAAD